MNSACITKHISECFVKPKYEVEESKQPYHLAPMDLSMLSFHYIQAGLLFPKPSHLNDQEFSAHSFVGSLKESLSLTLVHFYPLAGQLVTEVDEDKHESRVYVDCNKGPGARLVHVAAFDMNVSNILSQSDVPSVVHQSFFDLNEALNHDGHTKPLLSVQVTELQDGVFIACSVNHSITDGTSYWQFWNRWSEIHRAKGGDQICDPSRLPVHNRWFPEGYGPPIALPFTNPKEFVRKFEVPPLREKIFHFPSESIARLKGKANEESGTNNISSFKALCALVWRSMVRANHLPHDQVISNYLLANTRQKLNPPLPEYYFGNCIKALAMSTTAGELFENNLGWAASLLHESVSNLNDKLVRDYVNEWLQSRYCHYQGELHDCSTTAIERSPRFDLYGNEFGLGKALAVRSGNRNKGIGVVYASPAREGGGAVDVEISLPPDSMNALESDDEFLGFVSLPE